MLRPAGVRELKQTVELHFNPDGGNGRHASPRSSSGKTGEGSSPSPDTMVVYAKWQMQQTVNLLAYTFAGPSPAATTNVPQCSGLIITNLSIRYKSTLRKTNNIDCIIVGTFLVIDVV